MLRAFYHVWEQNHWREVLLEHFRILQRQRFSGPLTIGFIGQPYTEGFIYNMLQAHELNGTVHHFGPDPSQYEFPTLRLLEASVKMAPQDQYLYFHTKGVSRPNDWAVCNWRWYMNAFVLGQLKSLVSKLKGHDLAGVTWGSFFGIPPHFAGNFWLAQGQYLAGLPDFANHLENTRAWLEEPAAKQHSFLGLRHAAETWVGQNNPRVHDNSHEPAPIWDRHYWVQRPELQQLVARTGTQ
jgi:hypothetical protein